MSVEIFGKDPKDVFRASMMAQTPGHLACGVIDLEDGRAGVVFVTGTVQHLIFPLDAVKIREAGAMIAEVIEAMAKEVEAGRR